MSKIEPLLEVMSKLRNPDSGCPWDLEQTFGTIAPYTIEEAYEVADAIERDNMADLVDELGDLLLQVVFHAQIASDQGHFDFTDVVTAIVDKMIRRHPHVFGNDALVQSTVSEDRFAPISVAAQSESWEAIKEREAMARGESRKSRLDGVTSGLPSMLHARKIQKRAARCGFDWSDAAGALAKVSEECEEVRAVMDGSRCPAETGDGPPAHAQPFDEIQERLKDELGDLLFSCVNLSRHLGIDADSALRHASLKFESRFRSMEARASFAGTELETLSAAELDVAWESAKRESEANEARR